MLGYVLSLVGKAACLRLSLCQDREFVLTAHNFQNEGGFWSDYNAWEMQNCLPPNTMHGNLGVEKA
jgi:hypothetical protein